MKFPTIWIPWIRTCITSSSFSLLINGLLSKKCFRFSGIRQWDPFSPNFFIIVSHNLFAILNHAMTLDMIVGCDPRLRYNFNHLIYADDLILVSKATKRVGGNIKVCLSVYSNLTGQNPISL